MNTITQENSAPATLAPIVIDLLRYIQRLRTEFREELDGVREVMHLAVEMAADQDRKFDRLRERYLSLLAQHRALLSGKKAADERHALNESSLMADALAEHAGDRKVA